CDVSFFLLVLSSMSLHSGTPERLRRSATENGRLLDAAEGSLVGHQVHSGFLTEPHVRSYSPKHAANQSRIRKRRIRKRKAVRQYRSAHASFTSMAVCRAAASTRRLTLRLAVARAPTTNRISTACRVRQQDGNRCASARVRD